jgi:hypothetical protein
VGIYISIFIFFLLFCYRSWVFTPAPWFPFCCYFLIDHGYLHQHLDFVFILLPIMVIYTSTLIFLLLLFSYQSWLFTPASWFSFCCYFVIDHGDLHQHLNFVFYFVIDHGYLRQHLDFFFLDILLSIMVIYTSTLIFCFLFCYRSWIITSAPWISFCYVVTDHGYLHQHIDFLFVDILLSIVVIYPSTLILFLFCYRSWLFTPRTLILILFLFCYRSWRFTPAPWFCFLFCYRSWLFTPAHWFIFIIDHDYLPPGPWCWFCFYFVIDHGYLHQHIDLFLLSIMIIYPQHLDFDFVFILFSIMAIYTSTLIFLLLLFCYRSWLFTPAPWFYFLFCYRSWLFIPVIFVYILLSDHDYLHQHLD